MQILPQQVTRTVRSWKDRRELSDAAIGSRGGFVDVGGTLHLESFMGTLVIKLANEYVELSLLLKEVRTGRPRSFDL